MEEDLSKVAVLYNFGIKLKETTDASLMSRNMNHLLLSSRPSVEETERCF